MKTKVEYAPDFTKAVNRLKRHYRRIVQDTLPLIQQLQAGETPGDRVQNVVPYIVYKVRVKNSDAKRGKSGGYRAIYYVKTEDAILMLTIYSKFEIADIDPQQIMDIIRASEQSE